MIGRTFELVYGNYSPFIQPTSSPDGFDKVDTMGGGNAFKNQVVGLLQAVGYLKGMEFCLIMLRPSDFHNSSHDINQSLCSASCSCEYSCDNNRDDSWWIEKEAFIWGPSFAVVSSYMFPH